ncbi:unnamed protein product [Scytosiphon promiscuus]
MNKDSLEDGIVRSQAREARESHRSGRDAPSYHLGGPPESWETALGGTGERVSRQGRAVIEYADKMNGMGINERSLAGDKNPIADHVASMGQDKMRLLSGVPAGPTYVAGDVGGAPSQDVLSEEDDDAMSISSDWSNKSNENKAPPPQAQNNIASVGTTSGGCDVEADEGSPNDMDLIDDPDIQNAVEDFDSRNWTMEQLEVSCQTLLEECYASDDRRRRLLSAGMLLKLVETYPSALRYTYPRWMAQYRSLPGPIAAHKRMTLLMQGSELRARWRRVKANQEHGSLPASLLHAYLCIVLALIDAETCPKFCRMNRVKVVGACGLLALGVHFKTGDRSQRLACRILRELAREPLLIYELLNAGVAEYLSRLLPKLRETSIDRLLEALDAVDSMAFSAMRFCELSYANPDRGKGNSALVRALVENGSSIGGLESEIRIPNGNKLATTVCFHSVLQEILAYAGRALELLVQGIQSQEEIVPDMSLALFLQLCSRQEGRDGIEATDGVGMLRHLISGCQAQDSLVFLRGLTCALAVARQGVPGSPPGAAGEGRTPSATAPPGLSLPRAGGVGRSGPARPHPLDFEGKLYNDLVDLLDAPPPAPSRAVQGLVRMGSLEAVMRFLVREDDEEGVGEDDGMSLSVAGKAGRSGEKDPCRHRGPHYFRLKQRHACLGAVALHGLAVLAGPHPAIMTGSTLRYLCYSIQVTYIDLTVGKLAPGVEYPLMFRSIQLACRALAFLATSDTGTVLLGSQQEEGRPIGGVGQPEEGESDGAVDHGPLRRVADSLLSTTAINEVACIAQMPSRAAWAGDGGFMYRHLERTVSSAAILIAGVCPVPAGERDPFTRFDQPEDEALSLQLCHPLMERLVTSVGGPLCSTLMVAESLEIIAHACRALAKLSDNNVTIQMLLDDHDIMKALIRLGPRAPAVLPAAIRPDGAETAREERLSSERPACAQDEKRKRVERGANATLAPRRAVEERSERSRDGDAQGTARQERELEATMSVRGNGIGQHESRKGGGHRKAGDQRREGEGGPSSICSDDSAGRSPWVGHPVREWELADASTRKLCSLPFDYFRLVANVARVPSGRAIVQSSGTLKRCLERLALDVSGGPAAQLATLRCRSEICVLIARMAGTYDRRSGAANEFILNPRYQTLRVLLGMLATSAEHGRRSGASMETVELARHNAAYALAEVCMDTLRSVPLVADAGGIRLACRITNDVVSPMPLIKQVLRILQGAGSFPDGVYSHFIADPAVLRSLNRIANNAYPGFRPVTANSGGAHQPSSKAVERNPENSAAKHGGSIGGIEKGGGRDHVAPVLAFNLLKPRSPEARLISELATEVAYLVGAHASMSSPGPPTSPTRRKESSVLPKQQHARYDVVRRTETGRGDAFAATIPTESESVHEGGDKAPGKAAKTFTLVARVGSGAISGPPGTYLGCGVSSCKGLGYTGEHGDVAGNIPHAAYVLRKAEDGEDNVADNSGKVASDRIHQEERRDARGDRQTSDCASKREVTGERDLASSISGSPDNVVATPLALLSAREACFRDELVRRKEHYGLGGTIDEENTDDNGDRQDGPFRAPRTHEQDSRSYFSPFTAVERSGPFKTPRQSRPGSKMGGTSLCTAVDVAQSPLMATTRPAGLQPESASRCDQAKDRIDHSRRVTVVQPVRRCPGGPSGNRSASPGGKQFVTFARPAAHRSVTKSLIAESDEAPIKSSRVPGCPEEKFAGVVGRFACRGYLLDPTFTDHNPVILHPRLPRICGGGGSFRQVPEDLTSEALEAMRGGIGNAIDIEPYRNVVEVLRHNVEVLGDRKVAKQSFDEQAGMVAPRSVQHV